MKLTDLFKIDGSPMIPPDANMSISYEDLDDSDSGRDEGGFMHRIMVRYKVGTWSFSYTHMAQEEYTYIESLFAGKSTFQFTHPSATDPDTPETVEAYRSKYGIVWKSVKTGTYRDYKFNIIQC